MSRITHDFLERILREYTKNFDLTVQNFTCEPACEIGSNFTSDAKRITVTAGNYFPTQIKLIVKEKLTNSEVVAKFKLQNAFLNEARAYFQIIPEFEKILSLAVPRCFYADETITILSDLSAHGYKNVAKEGLNLKQIKDVLRELAKLHSASFILSVRNNAKLEELSKLTTEMVYERGNSFLDTQKFMLKTALEIFSKYEHPKQRIVLEVLENLLENSSELLCEVMHKPRKLKVITHGDCWENNILIKESSDLNEGGVIEEIFKCKQYFICQENCRCQEHFNCQVNDKENSTSSKENAASSKENLALTKKTPNDKENLASSKENSALSKENSASSKETHQTSSKEDGENSAVHKRNSLPKIISVLHKENSTRIAETPIKLIDFQAMRFTSVAADLSYFLYVNKTPAFRREHLQEVLNFYLECVRSYLRCAGVDVREFTEDWLRGEMREFRLFGFVNSLWLLPVRYFKKEDLVMNEYNEEDQDRKYKENFWENAENPGFVEVVTELVLEYVNGL